MGKVSVELSETKPCPNCRSVMLTVITDKCDLQIGCCVCGLRGPWGRYLREIIVPWEKMPRRANETVIKTEDDYNAVVAHMKELGELVERYEETQDPIEPPTEGENELLVCNGDGTFAWKKYKGSHLVCRPDGSMVWEEYSFKKRMREALLVEKNPIRK